MKPMKHRQPKQCRGVSLRQRERLLSAASGSATVKPAFLLGMLGSVALNALL